MDSGRGSPCRCPDVLLLDQVSCGAGHAAGPVRPRCRSLATPSTRHRVPGPAGTGRTADGAQRSRRAHRHRGTNTAVHRRTAGVNSSMLMPAPIMAGQPRPARRRAPPPTSQRRSRSSCARSVPAGRPPPTPRAATDSPGSSSVSVCSITRSARRFAPVSATGRGLRMSGRSPNLSATLRPPRRAGPSSAAARRIGMAVTPRSPWEPPPCWRKPCAAHHGRHPTGVVLTRPGMELDPAGGSSRFRISGGSGAASRSQGPGLPSTCRTVVRHGR
jgi:hypothetical protein